MRIEKPQTPHRRASPRKPLVRVGVLEIVRQTFNCIIVDLSQSGAKVRTLKELRSRPDQLTLHLKGIGKVRADVAWMRGNDMGLKFHTETSVPDSHDNSSITEFLAMIPTKPSRS